MLQLLQGWKWIEVVNSGLFFSMIVALFFLETGAAFSWLHNTHPPAIKAQQLKHCCKANSRSSKIFGMQGASE